jgi:cyanophycinase
MEEELMRRKMTFSLLALAAALTLPADAKVTRYLTGNAADVVVTLAGPAHDFGGGGTDVDAALQWIIDKVRGCTTCSTKIDVVILRSTGSNGYNDYIYAMNGVDSVETLVITSARDANTAAVEATVRNAEVVFFAGGDQCDYVRNFKGTLVETAVESVYAKGGGVGGTSAGLAIQGDFTYDACSGSVTSVQALADPYHRYVTFTYDFFKWANLQNVITDSHFVTRDRMGRTLAFLARQIKDGKAASALGVAVNEATSVVVDRNGLATVIGDGPAYFILADHAPEVCQTGTPLTYSNYKIWKVLPGGTFDLKNRPTTGFYLRSVNNGVISSDPY